MPDITLQLVPAGQLTVVLSDEPSITAQVMSEVLGGVVAEGEAIDVAYTAPVYTVSLDINELTEDVAPDTAADWLVTFDASAGVHKKTHPSSVASNYTDENAQDAVGNILTDSATVDFTYTDAVPSITAIVIDDSITYAKMQNVSAASRLIGRGDSGAGDPQEIVIGAGLAMTGTTLSASAGAGDVVGPASATADAIARYDGVTGKLIQNSNAAIDDNGNVSTFGTNSGFIVVDRDGSGFFQMFRSADISILWNDEFGNLLAFTTDGRAEFSGPSVKLDTLELGHASDTTLSRVSAGTVAIEGQNILTEGTAEAFVETAIDTLPNLTSVQGRTVTLADAGFDVLFGWDDSGSAYKNFLLADILTEAAPATGDYVLIYGAEGDLRKVNWSAVGTGGAREALTADRTYFVRTDGSNSNDGLTNTAGGAWLTIQYAYDWVAENIDTAGFTLTIKVDTGTYSPAVTTVLTIPGLTGFDVCKVQREVTGGGLVVFEGDTTTPSNVVIDTTNGGIGFYFNVPGVWCIRGFKFSGGGTGGQRSIYLNVTGAEVIIDDLDFGDVNGIHITTALQSCVVAYQANLTISGDADQFIFTELNGGIDIESSTITLTGTPAFDYFISAQFGGVIYLLGNTYTGAATGQRFILKTGAHAFVADSGFAYLPTTALPGDVAGTLDTTSTYNDVYIHDAASITFDPAGNIAATDVQTAIEELDAEKQPLDADLTSWASVVRAAGFDTFVATPSSANLAALVTGETGTGALVFATSPALVTPDLGTPSAVVLTNGTGLPLAGVLDSTTEALGVGSLELGHASDTTLTRVSAGVIAVEGVTVLTEGNAEAFVETAIDTLANLTSIQGFTVTFADAGFDVLSGWDDSASAHKNFLLADILTEAAPATGDFVLIYGAEGDLRKVNWSGLPGGGSSPGGSDTFVQFNDSSTFGGDAGLTYNKTSNALTITGGSLILDEVSLLREAANIVAQRNTTNDQTYRLYRTFTDASNYERLAIGSAAGAFTLTAESAGTGTDDIDIKLVPANQGRAYLTSSVASALPSAIIENTDTLADFGFSGTVACLAPNLEPGEGTYFALGRIVTTRNVAFFEFGYVGAGSTSNFFGIGFWAANQLLTVRADGIVGFGGVSSASFPGLKRVSAALETRLTDDSARAQHNAELYALTDGITAPSATAGLAKVFVDTADGDLKVIFGGGSVRNLSNINQYFELTEIADPAAPAANKARLYSRDNGSGKTQLVVRFPSGAVQVIATEP